LMKREDYHEIRTGVAEFFCALNRTTTIGELWVSLVSGRLPPGTSSDVNWKKMFRIFDHRRLVTFGQVHGLIKRVHAFPLLIDDGGLSSSSLDFDPERQNHINPPRSMRAGVGQTRNHVQAEKRRKTAALAASMMDGTHCDDAIVCACELPLEKVFALFANQRIASVLATVDAQQG